MEDKNMTRKKAMNVLMACDYLGPNPGNFIPSILELEKYIQRKDGRVIYAFSESCRKFNWCKELLSQGAIIYFYESKSLLYGVRFLNKIIKKERITIIHTHFEPFDKPTLVIKVLHPSIKVVWHLHDDFSLGRITKPTISQRIKAALRDFLVTTIAVSPHIKTKKGYVLINHLAPTYLPCGTKYDTSCDVLREKLGMQPDQCAILFFGWDKIRKGLDIACEMLSYLSDDERNRCKLYIQVTKSSENEQFVKDHCAYPELICWLKSTSDVYNYHMAADIMLSAARSETFAYTIMEAIAVGTSVVSSDIPGVAWSKSFHNVWYFRSEDAKDCAEAVMRCIKEYDRSVAIDAAHEIRDKLQISEWCQKIYDIYIGG